MLFRVVQGEAPACSRCKHLICFGCFAREFLDANQGCDPNCEPLSRMDPASAIISFIGFGVPVVDGILKLKGFLNDVQDAPDYVQKLQSELDLLIRSINLFRKVDQTRSISVPEDIQTLVEEASGRVQEQIEDVLELLQKLIPSGRTGRPRKLWNKVNVVLKKDKVTKLIEELERAEKTLQMVHRAMEQ